MPETNTVDEEVAMTPKAGATSRGPSARTTHDETLGPDGKVTAQRGGVEDENHSLVRTGGRKFNASTEALLAKMESAPDDGEEDTGLAPHEEGDADEDEPDDAPAPDDTGEAEDEPEPAEDDAAQAVNARLAARNTELIAELDAARKTPKTQRTDRETALVAAEATYYDEGSVPALRKFLAVITGAAPDSKEVDAELTGLYSDLTVRELGVALDDNQRALRDNARTRLLLARDKREKVEADKKPVADDSVEADVNYGAATKYVDNVLSTKVQNGASLADEYPMLMDLAEDFDGFKPGEVLARAIRREILTGTLDPKAEAIDMIRHVAPKIEKHYDAVAKRIEATRAKTKKTDTTTPSGKKPKVAEASTERRQSTGAPTITNATASRAPAKNPKVDQKKAASVEGKTRKDFPSEAAWKDHLFSKHFQS